MTRAFRTPFLVLSLLFLALLALPAGGARAQDREVDLDTFYTELDRHGRWFTHPTHGYVWSPDVDPDWRPYTRGQWVFTDEHGWYWQSEEPFGWAVFHYGRWFLDDDSGWVWVPGTQWAPAWVSWRHSDDQVGWAPLPPEAEWRDNSLHFSQRYYDSPRYTAAWCFVPVALLTAATVYRHVYHPSRNNLYVRQTNWVPFHRGHHRQGIFFNSGFDRGRYERITRRPITPVRLVEVNRPQEYGRRGNFGRTNEINVYRPRIAIPSSPKPPPRFSEPPRRNDYPPVVRPGWPRPTDPQRDARPPQPGTPGNPDVSRRRPGDERRPPQQPVVVQPPVRQTPPVQQPATIPPPRQPSIVQPPVRQPPPVQQPVTIPPPRQPSIAQPPVRQPPPVQQPATIPPPRTSQPPGVVPPAGRSSGPPQGNPQREAPKGEKGDGRRRPQQGDQPQQPR